MTSETAVRPTCWVFHHLPKTAGSSIAEDFQLLLQPYYTVFVGQTPPPSGSEYHDALDLEFFRFARKTLDTDYRFVSGHLFRHHIQWFASMPQARIFTFLRDPLKRLISEYRYQQTPISGDWQGFLRRYPSFDHFLKDRSRHNVMATSIGGKDATAQEAIGILAREYFFFGVTERYDEAVALLLQLAGGTLPPQARVNVTPPKVPIEVTEPERYRAVVEALNEADTGLYRFAAEEADRQLEHLRHVLEASTTP